MTAPNMAALHTKVSRKSIAKVLPTNESSSSSLVPPRERRSKIRRASTSHLETDNIKGAVQSAISISNINGERRLTINDPISLANREQSSSTIISKERRMSASSDRRRSINAMPNASDHHMHPHTSSSHSLEPNQHRKSHKVTKESSIAVINTIPTISERDPKLRNSTMSTRNSTIIKTNSKTIIGTYHYNSKGIKKKKKNFFIKILELFGFVNHTVDVLDPKALEVIKTLNLTNTHLRKLRWRFDQIDIDGSGTIDADEFLENLGEPASPFTRRLFDLIGVCMYDTTIYTYFISVYSIHAYVLPSLYIQMLYYIILCTPIVYY